MCTQLKIDREPVRICFVSEPYAKFTSRGYQVAADIITKKRKKEYFLYLGAKSLSEQLHALIQENNNILSGIEVWIHKDGDDKYSKYVLEL